MSRFWNENPTLIETMRNRARSRGVSLDKVWLEHYNCLLNKLMQKKKYETDKIRLEIYHYQIMNIEDFIYYKPWNTFSHEIYYYINHQILTTLANQYPENPVYMHKLRNLDRYLETKPWLH